MVLAEDTVLARMVALKRLSPLAGGQAASRLRREALVGASLSHANLVSIYDIFPSEDGGHVIVMEYVEGENLRDALARQGRLAIPEVLRVLTGVAAALDAIHRQGIVHRDVKPANILLGSDGIVKLADLGIASAPDHTRITSTDAVVGSFRYMAPEQLHSAPSTPAIDVYALSAVAFEVLSGRKARGEPNPMALAHAIATQPPPDLRAAWPEASPVAAELLARGMARDPAARPRSAGELVRRLRAALEPAPTAPIRPSVKPVPAPAARIRPILQYPPQPERRGRSRPAALAALIAAIAAVVALALAGTLGGASKRTTGTTASRGHAKTRAASSAAKSGSSQATSANSSPPSSVAASSTIPASTAPSTPIAAVESFYGLSAAHNYDGAWALADPAFRAQLGGYDSFQAGQSGDVSIRFNSAQVLRQTGDSATVSISTTSVRQDGSHLCGGTVDLNLVSRSWLLHQIHINCT